jgi:hypothetical protein
LDEEKSRDRRNNGSLDALIEDTKNDATHVRISRSDPFPERLGNPQCFCGSQDPGS